MDNDLRQKIGEIYGSEAWVPITGTLWQDGTPWVLYKFEGDVEHNGNTWRCVIIAKIVFDPDDLTAVDYTEDVLAEAWTV